LGRFLRKAQRGSVGQVGLSMSTARKGQEARRLTRLINYYILFNSTESILLNVVIVTRSLINAPQPSTVHLGARARERCRDPSNRNSAPTPTHLYNRTNYREVMEDRKARLAALAARRAEAQAAALQRTARRTSLRWGLHWHPYRTERPIPTKDKIKSKRGMAPSKNPLRLLQRKRRHPRRSSSATTVRLRRHPASSATKAVFPPRRRPAEL
jgi:hypothetical protein